MWNCLWGHALKRSLGINRKSRELYPGPEFLSSATWPSMPKKHFNGLIKLFESQRVHHSNIQIKRQYKNDMLHTWSREKHFLGPTLDTASQKTEGPVHRPRFSMNGFLTFVSYRQGRWCLLLIFRSRTRDLGQIGRAPSYARSRNESQLQTGPRHQPRLQEWNIQCFIWLSPVDCRKNNFIQNLCCSFLQQSITHEIITITLIWYNYINKNILLTDIMKIYVCIEKQWKVVIKA